MSHLQTKSILLALLLTTTGLAAVAPVATAEAAPVACVLLYEIHDVERNWLCVGPDYCQAYLKKETWGGTHETCLVPHGVASAAGVGQPWPLCQQLMVGPDIDRGVCVDPRADCIVLWYDTYNTGGGDRCYVENPDHAVARIQHCERIFYGPDIDSGLCVDSGAACKAWLYNAYGNDTCLAPPEASTAQASAADCGEACVSDCHVQVRPVGVWAWCEVGHQPTGLRDYCLTGYSCATTYAECSALTWQDIAKCSLPRANSDAEWSPLAGPTVTRPAHCQDVFSAPDVSSYRVCYDAGDLSCPVYTETSAVWGHHKECVVPQL